MSILILQYVVYIASLTCSVALILGPIIPDFRYCFVISAVFFLELLSSHLRFFLFLGESSNFCIFSGNVPL